MIENIDQNHDVGSPVDFSASRPHAGDGDVVPAQAPYSQETTRDHLAAAPINGGVEK